MLSGPKTSANVSPMSSATATIATTGTTPPAAVRGVAFGGGGTGACRFWGTSGGCRRGETLALQSQLEWNFQGEQMLWVQWRQAHEERLPTSTEV